MFDIAVIGAGPAGSAAAKRCAEHGLSAVILEKKRLPRDKVCSGMIIGPLAQTLIKQEFGDIPEHDRDTVEKILSATVNVLALVHYHIYFPLHSIRLREVGRYMGCSFSDQISSGIESIVFREEWEHSGDKALKDALIAYNREDCEALRVLCDLIRTSAALVVTKERPPGRKEDIVLSSSLRKAGEGNRPVFKKADFLLPEFDIINRCAYFDYQRDRVYARSEKRVAQPRRQIPHTVRRAS